MALNQVAQFLLLLLLPLVLLGMPGLGKKMRWMALAFVPMLVVLTLGVGSAGPRGEGWPWEQTLWRNPTELNRNLTASVALVWPAMIAVSRGRRLWVGLLLPLALVPPVLMGESQSAQFGLAIGLAVLLVTRLAPTLARCVVIVATVALFAGTIPLTLALPAISHGIEWLPFSARHRLDIWSFVAERIAERPVLGWGLEASRHLGEGRVTQILDTETDMLPLHPHNAYLQVWLELGMIGATLALAGCLLVVRAISHLDASIRPAALAAYASTAAMAATSYGIWQSWWMATLMLTALLTAAAASNRPA
ncbi:MAG TPA: O-antigen ligase family protein [Kaistia sp.]|jgi:O-antigen ligase|nr:O-antigen ligase family protein [Kaistia sp.]